MYIHKAMVIEWSIIVLLYIINSLYIPKEQSSFEN